MTAKKQKVGYQYRDFVPLAGAGTYDYENRSVRMGEGQVMGVWYRCYTVMGNLWAESSDLKEITRLSKDKESDGIVHESARVECRMPWRPLGGAS